MHGSPATTSCPAARTPTATSPPQTATATANGTPAGQTYIVQEGDTLQDVHLILTGWACRYKQLEDGRRQIVSFFRPGDICDVNIFLLREMDHSIGTITPVTIAELSRDFFDTISTGYPRIAAAFDRVQADDGLGDGGAAAVAVGELADPDVPVALDAEEPLRFLGRAGRGAREKARVLERLAHREVGMEARGVEYGTDSSRGAMDAPGSLAEDGDPSSIEAEEPEAALDRRRLRRLERGKRLVRVSVRVGGGLEGEEGGFVRGNVIGMPVPADGVMRDDDLRAQGPKMMNQFCSDLFDLLVGQCVRVAVVSRAGHPGVAVPGHDHARKPQLLGRAPELGRAELGASVPRGSRRGVRDRLHPEMLLEPPYQCGKGSLGIGALVPVSRASDWHE